MQIRILHPVGVFADSSGTLVFPSVGDAVEVTEAQGRSMCASGQAEVVKAEATSSGSSASSGSGSPSKRRTKAPKKTTVGKGPEETR